jgi:hypothetical protein
MPNEPWCQPTVSPFASRGISCEPAPVPVARSAKAREDSGEELADVAIYLLSLAEMTGVDRRIRGPLTIAFAILLTGGDKTGQWKTWYERAIPQAEELYSVYVKERAEEEGQ